MNDKPYLENAYLAGLFDGEGSVGLYMVKNGRNTSSGKCHYWAAQLTICGTYRPMIEAAHFNIPGSIFLFDKRHTKHITPKKKYNVGKCKQLFKIRINRKKDIKLFLERIFPYLIEKKKQVKIILDWINGDIDGNDAALKCKVEKKFKF